MNIRSHLAQCESGNDVNTCSIIKLVSFSIRKVHMRQVNKSCKMDSPSHCYSHYLQWRAQSPTSVGGLSSRAFALGLDKNPLVWGSELTGVCPWARLAPTGVGDLSSRTFARRLDRWFVLWAMVHGRTYIARLWTHICLEHMYTFNQ